jgi:hypothetical protein
MLYQLLLSLAALLWGGLWGYSTLLIALVWMKETESLYSYPMQAAMDRFVDILGCGWLKPLHDLPQWQLRWISYGLFGFVSLGVCVVILVVD